MWQYLVVWIVATVVTALLTPKPKINAPTPGDLNGIATAEAGRPIPVLFGTRRIQAPNVVWWGDVATEPIKEKSGKK